MRLGDTCSDGTHADFGNQLDADAGFTIGILEVVDELGEILDGIDVVMRRWRNQSHPRGRMTHLGDPWIHLTPGQLASLARFCPLGHLDLDLLGLGQIEAGDTEAARGDLFDGTIFGISLIVGPCVSCGILATLSGI